MAAFEFRYCLDGADHGCHIIFLGGAGIVLPSAKGTDPEIFKNSSNNILDINRSQLDISNSKYTPICSLVVSTWPGDSTFQDGA